MVGALVELEGATSEEVLVVTGVGRWVLEEEGMSQVRVLPLPVGGTMPCL